MSVRPCLSRKLARESYSTWPRSGGLVRLQGVGQVLVGAGVARGTVFNLTWISGFSLFHTSMACWMPGTQDQ